MIVHKIDRLARNRADDVAINLALTQAGAQLVSVTENIDDTPAGKMMHGILAVMNQYQSDNNATEAAKGMLKKADGTPMKYEDFRVVWKSPLLAGSPYAILNDMPEELKKKIGQAFLDAPKKAKEAFEKLSDGKDLGFAAVTHADYIEFVKLNKYLEDLRKQKS